VVLESEIWIGKTWNHEINLAKYVAWWQQTKLEWAILDFKLYPFALLTASVPVDPLRNSSLGWCKQFTKASLAGLPSSPPTCQKSSCLIPESSKLVCDIYALWGLRLENSYLQLVIHSSYLTIKKVGQRLTTISSESTEMTSELGVSCYHISYRLLKPIENPSLKRFDYQAPHGLNDYWLFPLSCQENGLASVFQTRKFSSRAANKTRPSIFFTNLNFPTKIMSDVRTSIRIRLFGSTTYPHITSSPEYRQGNSVFCTGLSLTYIGLIFIFNWKFSLASQKADLQYNRPREMTSSTLDKISYNSFTITSAMTYPLIIPKTDF